MPRPTRVEDTPAPLHVILGEIAGLWILANAGYYSIFPLFGLELSYNSTPIGIALYFMVWAGISIFSFWDVFTVWLKVEHRIWVYLLWSLGFSGLIWGLLYLFSLLPMLTGIQFAPSTDILFASPWYFLPKSAEVLVQQILITVLVLELSSVARSLKRVVLL